MLALVQASLQFAQPDLSSVDGWALFMLVLITISIQIGMLSILIAQLSLAYEEISHEKGGYSKMKKAFIAVETESLLSSTIRNQMYHGLEFDQPLEFDSGDLGPSGGVQWLEPATVRSHPSYVSDRIIRFPGAADVHDPWPEEESGGGSDDGDGSD